MATHTIAPTDQRINLSEKDDADFGALKADVEEDNEETRHTGESTLGSDMKIIANSAGSEKDDAAPPLEWAQRKEQTHRVLAAVKCAIAVPEIEAIVTPSFEKGSDEKSVIALELSDAQPFIIPWNAGRTWLRMEAFLREWFSHDGSALKAFDNGYFTIKTVFGDEIYTELWKSTVFPGARLEISLKLPSLPQIFEEAELTETSYENRVQYKVSYYRRQETGDRSDFIRQDVYAEPIELEVADEHEKVPVLEESKDVESPHDSVPNYGSVSGKAHKKLRKLRQADIVSDPVLKIHSPYLLNVLKAVVECSAEPPAGGNYGLDAGVFEYPFMDLYLHLDDVLDYKTGKSGLRNRHSDWFNHYADEHIELLRSYLESQPTIQYNEAKARWGKNVPSTTFGTLWLLMKPGTDVYVREIDGSLNRYIMDRLKGGTSRDRSGKKVTLKYTAKVWNLALDDKAIRQQTRQIDIQVFDDERQITKLPVFPVQYQDRVDNGATLQALIDRGQKYFAYSKRPCFLQYDGDGLKAGTRSYKHARVVVEHVSRPWRDGAIMNSIPIHHIPDLEDIPGESMRVARCECKDCQTYAASQETYLRLNFSDYREIDPTKIDKLTDHQYSILPSHMFAFVLNDRNYDLLDVARLQEPIMAETAIDRLVMPHGNKELIKAVAKTYTDNSALFSADFIHGKGEGQIILLHGPPGTGKTLTAESVAEFTKRPLLNITAADLGSEPDELETSLLRYFRRANEWDAIVLLDEADVYLEKRSTSDLERNSIVSVFLRALDYFQGILFLTTNRVAQFDEAFMSRIHLSLGYDKLSDDARTQIWGNLFQKLKDDHKSGGPKIEYDYDAKRYVTKDEEVKALQWNGREIRNAFQTAVALAVYDSKAKAKNGEPAIPEVTEDHLRQVVSMSSAFRKYITAAHEGMDDSVWAFKHGNRDDRVSSLPTR